MARPHKDPDLRKAEQLRIPVTEAEKSSIVEAATLAGLEMAPWARAILTREAERQIGEVTARKGRRAGK